MHPIKLLLKFKIRYTIKTENNAHDQLMFTLSKTHSLHEKLSKYINNTIYLRKVKQV